MVDPTPRAPGVTVVIPTHNRAALLAQTLSSVREQTFEVADLIVADDGSEDDTAAVAEAFGARLLENPGGGWGPSAARNAGLAEVQTEFVAFVDSDDLLRPRALEILAGELGRHEDAPFAYGRALRARREAGGWVPESLITTEAHELEELAGTLFARNSVHLSGALARTASVRSVSGFDVGIVYSEDHQLWIELSRLGRPVHVPEMVSIHRSHATNRHTAISALADEMTITRLAQQEPELRRWRASRHGFQLLGIASEAVRRRDWLRAGRGVRELLLTQPDRLRILRAAVLHFSARRRRSRWARQLWSREPELRAWLARF